MEIKQKVIVNFANAYKMTDEKTGRNVEGITIQYIMSSDLISRRDEDGIMGIKVNKGSLPLEKLPNLPKAPAVYEATFALKTNSSGKPELVLTDVKYVDEIVCSTMTDYKVLIERLEELENKGKTGKTA